MSVVQNESSSGLLKKDGDTSSKDNEVLSPDDEIADEKEDEGVILTSWCHAAPNTPGRCGHNDHRQGVMMTKGTSYGDDVKAAAT